MSDRLGRAQTHPKYRELVRRRNRFGWSLSAVMLLAYFGYILLIAFDKELLARPIGNGVTSIGIPLGFGIILLGVLLTAIYVRRANSVFDALLRSVVEDVAE